jgi:hypothetical protein
MSGEWFWRDTDGQIRQGLFRHREDMWGYVVRRLPGAAVVSRRCGHSAYRDDTVSYRCPGLAGSMVARCWSAVGWVRALAPCRLGQSTSVWSSRASTASTVSGRAKW